LGKSLPLADGAPLLMNGLSIDFKLLL